MTPEMVAFEGLTLSGLSGDFAPETSAGIARLWDAFMKGSMGAGNEVMMPCYGASYNVDMDGGGFSYLAGIPAGQYTALPEGFVELELPAGKYARFTHKTSGPEKFLEELQQSFGHIFQTWLPASGYSHAGTPVFELYDDRFNGKDVSGEFDIYVPVIKK